MTDVDRRTDCADIIMGLLIMGTALLKAQVLHALTLRSLILRLLCVSIDMRSLSLSSRSRGSPCARPLPNPEKLALYAINALAPSHALCPLSHSRCGRSVRRAL